MSVTRMSDSVVTEKKRANPNYTNYLEKLVNEQNSTNEYAKKLTPSSIQNPSRSFVHTPVRTSLRNSYSTSSFNNLPPQPVFANSGATPPRINYSIGSTPSRSSSISSYKPNVTSSAIPPLYLPPSNQANSQRYSSRAGTVLNQPISAISTFNMPKKTSPQIYSSTNAPVVIGGSSVSFKPTVSSVTTPYVASNIRGYSAAPSTRLSSYTTHGILGSVRVSPRNSYTQTNVVQGRVSSSSNNEAVVPGKKYKLDEQGRKVYISDSIVQGRPVTTTNINSGIPVYSPRQSVSSYHAPQLYSSSRVSHSTPFIHSSRPVRTSVPSSSHVISQPVTTNYRASSSYTLPRSNSSYIPSSTISPAQAFYPSTASLTRGSYEPVKVLNQQQRSVSQGLVTLRSKNLKAPIVSPVPQRTFNNTFKTNTIASGTTLRPSSNSGAMSSRTSYVPSSIPAYNSSYLTSSNGLVTSSSLPRSRSVNTLPSSTPYYPSSISRPVSGLSRPLQSSPLQPVRLSTPSVQVSSYRPQVVPSRVIR